jgi:hypothetical protein
MKRSFMLSHRGGFILAFFSFILAAGAQAFGQSQPAMQTTMQGFIVSVDSTSIMLSLADGKKQSVALSKDTLVLKREPAALADISAGEALGVAAKKGADGSLTATSINIFSPELWKVVRKGRFPMQSGEVMTNAVVDNLTAAMVMGRTLFMKYESLSAVISVPPEADIHRILTVTESDLKPGLTVSVRGTIGSKGTLAASTVSFDTPGA